MNSDFDQKTTELSTIEKALLVALRKMSSTDQNSLMRFVEALANTKNRSEAESGDMQE
ncbi:hypothetical protein ACFSVK_19300 [Azorhizophilus paspali]|uniref:Uncharacterized protein n=1 Tax=Azorhizophilus paspali TaxID=69963 RepID=A0ABV6SH36_AZOPA